MEKRIIKIERHYEDGTSDYIDGQYLENYLINIGIADTLSSSRTYIIFKDVIWTKKSFDQAVDDLRNELIEREKAFLNAHNIIFDDEKIDEKDVEFYEDEIDICELYHQIRSGTHKPQLPS